MLSSTTAVPYDRISINVETSPEESSAAIEAAVIKAERCRERMFSISLICFVGAIVCLPLGSITSGTTQQAVNIAGLALTILGCCFGSASKDP